MKTKVFECRFCGKVRTRDAPPTWWVAIDPILLVIMKLRPELYQFKKTTCTGCLLKLKYEEIEPQPPLRSKQQCVAESAT